MKKLPLIITLIVLSLLVGGYFIYSKFFVKSQIALWDLVPSETILVYESSACEPCINEITNSPITEIIQRATVQSTLDSFSVIKDFLVSEKHPGKLVSLHIIKKDEFDFIFYVPLNKKITEQFFSLQEQLQKFKGTTITEHEYNEVLIHEITFNKKTFSWIHLDNALVMSFTPVLIEDVIRTRNSETGGFSDQLSAVYKLPRIKNDGGNIFLHLKNFTRWFSLFMADRPSAVVQQFGQSALLDVKVNEDNRLVLNGFSLDSTSNSNYLLSVFKNQQPVPLSLKQFISNRTFMFTSYGISDGKKFQSDIKPIQKGVAKDTLEQLSRTLNVNFDNLLTSFKGEIGLCWLESRTESVSKILLLNVLSGIDPWKKTFSTLSSELSIDTVFVESYSGYEIREIPIHHFPEKLFEPLISGFTHTYYTSVGNTMIMSEDLEELKRFLEDIDHEETWGKSVAQNKFLESTLLESNVNLFIDIPKSWNTLLHSLQPKWKNFVQQNRPLLNSLGMGAIQFSHLNNSYYTNVSLNFTKTKSEERIATERMVTNFTSSIAKLFLLKSHINKAGEVLIQDSLMNLSLLGKDGKVLWKLPLDNYIIDHVAEVDFFKNGKLQYFFATPGALHVVDRLGNYVKPYPIPIAESEIDFISIVDYDHSKKYRFLVSGKSGKLWMYDKQGNNLEGWQPKLVEDQLAAPAEHHRILGKDYVVAICADGKIYLMNRRGEVLKNFPLDLNARPSGDYFLNKGRDRATTYFVIISRDGFRIKFDLDGKILSREPLVKATLSTKFSLVNEGDGKSYLIVRQEPTQLIILDENLTELINSDYLGNNPTSIKYQNFGSGEAYITITDLSQDLSFVYNGKGKLLTILPLESNKITLQRDKPDNPKIIYSYRNNLTTRSLN